MGNDLTTFSRLAEAQALTTPLANSIFLGLVDLNISAFGGDTLQLYHPSNESTQISPYRILGYLVMLERMLMICEDIHQNEIKSRRSRIYDPICFRLSAADRTLLFQDAMNELCLDKRQLQFADECFFAGVRRWKELAQVML